MSDQKIDSEIDLSVLQDKVNALFDGGKSAVFRFFQFLLKNSIWIGILVVAGFALGWMKDNGPKVYETQIIVSPNFGSIDYLYGKIELLESKIKERDSVFLMNNGIKNPSKLVLIKVEPVIDIYSLINRSNANFDMIKLMAEDSDMKKIIEDPVTSKNYQYHLITITTVHRTNPKWTVTPILEFLNASPYFARIQSEYLKNTQFQIAAEKQTIDQINGILDQLGKNNGQSSGQVYINQNTQLNDVLQTKSKLVDNLGNLNIALIRNQKIIKDNVITMNIMNEKGIFGKMRYILPIVFVILFLLVKCLISFYKTQSAKHKLQS